MPSTGDLLTFTNAGQPPTYQTPSGGSGTVTSVDMTVPTFLSVAGNPITTSGTLAVTLSGTALPIANGGTAVTSVTVSPTASSFAGWDSNSNMSANSFKPGYATTATSGATTTLTVSSAQREFFTGSTTQTVLLPVTSTLSLGQSYEIVNLSSGAVTVQSSGGNTLQAMATGSRLVASVIATSGTGTASWSWSYELLIDGGGSVTSVSGTTNRITSTGGATPVIDISASYVGQSSITTLGTIGTGVWEGTVVGSTYGGTGVNNGSSTLTLAGNLATSGAFATTFTMTGATSVTFPTSGTLSTTTGTVTSVSGTSNRITSTGGTTPVIDISASYVGQSSITTLGTITTGVWTGTTIAIANGGTAVTSVTTAPTATSFAGWDASANLSADNFIAGYATTVTAAGTTTLTVDSKQQQYFTGSTTQTVTLPVTSTLVTGFSFTIVNLSSGVVTVQSSGGNTLQAMDANTKLIATVILTSGTGTASWSWFYAPLTGGGGVSSVSGTSNRITSTGGATPVIDISASYVGQASITTLGTITSGTWTGTTIAVANGGTGITSFGTGVATALGQNVTGSGGIVLATSPTLVTPALGTPTAIVLTSGTGLPLTTGVTGVLPGANGGTGVANTGFTMTLQGSWNNVDTTAASASSLTPNSDTNSQYDYTALAANLTINADSGTPYNGKKLTFRFLDNATPRTLTWASGSTGAYQAIGITLPTTTVASKITYVGFIYNSNAARWDGVATVTQA